MTGWGYVVLAVDSFATRGVVNAWPVPAARLKAQLRLKRGEKDERPAGLVSFLPTKAARLRIESVIVNEAGEHVGMALFQNMRVPEASIIARVFNGEPAGEAHEDLSWWESTGKGSLQPLPIRVIARRPASGIVEALIVADKN